ncbi:hypothetical protein [Actinacidiphila oryziradicis]|uniref:Uncharacterized protein n=1 Tax=Actinacidiphila oryziradicis TaxID=2571141 RepID=A0A4U0RWP0_9ACTN|nr:hypothetical protein [Actinacidiphila oryziradicis]TKA00726.1 hypothetical protein FCI23_42155 [Actinacidiphila oryziradicis]
MKRVQVTKSANGYLVGLSRAQRIFLSMIFEYLLGHSASDIDLEIQTGSDRDHIESLLGRLKSGAVEGGRTADEFTRGDLHSIHAALLAVREHLPSEVQFHTTITGFYREHAADLADSLVRSADRAE